MPRWLSFCLFAGLIWGAGSPGVAGAQTPDLTGVWLMQSQEGQSRVEFSAQGVYVATMMSQGRVEREQGRYRVLPGVIEVLTPEGQTQRFSYQQTAPGRLQLVTPDGKPALLVRSAGPAGAGQGAQTQPGPGMTPATPQGQAPRQVWPQPGQGGYGQPQPGPGMTPAAPQGQAPRQAWPQPGQGGYGQPQPGPGMTPATPQMQAPAPAQGQPGAPRSAKAMATAVFQRYQDRSEGAFSLLIPAGWQAAGGMNRVNPTQAGGAANAIEARLDFGVMKDPQGTVMIRWLPHTYFADTRGMPAANMGMLRPGSNYGGMTVMYLMNAASFAQRVAFPYLRPQAQGARVIAARPLPKVAQAFHALFRMVSGNNAQWLNFQYDASLVTFTYQEGGVAYLEKMLVVIENRGPAVAGQWCNRYTVAIRAPASQFPAWAPVLGVMGESFKLNPQWMARESQGQATRAGIAGRVQQEVQAIDRAIGEHRRLTNAEISNDMYLNLTSQEEYVNPFSGKTETGSNQWNHRWENPQGYVIYSDDPNYDPGRDPNLHIQGFKPSKVRPRFPGQG